jgi:selenocysteine lyase/cysteine desulfurase
MTPDFVALRREFPVLTRKTYLNSGAYCALATSVRDAFNAYMDDRLAVGADWDVWVMKNEAVRNLMAKVLNCTPDEMAVTASASAGINSIASAFDFTGTRNKVVVSDFEFPTNAQIWHAQEKRGAQIVHVPIAADGYIPLENFAAAIDERTALVAVTHVCFRNGAKLDIAGIVKLAHAKGAKILIDCYQAVGAVDIDVKALDTDFAVGGMLKYLLGTAGIGFLYCRGELVQSLVPTHSGWFAQKDIAAMNIFGNVPSPTARRFEAGTPPVPNCYATEAGLEFILKVGTPAIEKRIQQLTRRCMEKLNEIGWASHTPSADSRRGPMVCVKSKNAAELAKRLMARDIVTSYRDQSIRATIHFYNTDEDIDTLIAALADLRTGLK